MQNNIIRIPVNVNLPCFSFTITLEGVGYKLEMAYLTRADRWSLTVSNLSGQPIVHSIPLLIDRDLLAGFRSYAVPPGSLFCVDTTGAQAQPGLGSFLTTHAMYYAEKGT